MNVDTDDDFGVKCHSEYAIQNKDAFLYGIKICDVSVDDVDNDYRKISKDDFTLELYKFMEKSSWIIENYQRVYIGRIQFGETPVDIKMYLQKQRPKNFKGHSIG